MRPFARPFVARRAPLAVRSVRTLPHDLIRAVTTVRADFKEPAVIRLSIRSRSLRSTSFRTAFVLALACAATACTNMGQRRGRDVEASASTRLETETTIDVAVLPIENASGKKSLPAKELRGAFERALVQRRYSPLATEYVDAQIVDAAFKPGSVKEDAQLVVSVDAWDDSLWTTHSAVTLKIRARLVDSRGGADLWKGTLEKRIEIGADRESYSTEAPLRAKLCQQIASEVLAALPARTPTPGRAR